VNAILKGSLQTATGILLFSLDLGAPQNTYYSATAVDMLELQNTG
jgi:hypothetical protein